MIEKVLKTLGFIGIFLLKLFQFTIIFLLSGIIFIIQYNNCKFVDRWQFESVDLNTAVDVELDSDKNYFATVKKHWSVMKRAITKLF